MESRARLDYALFQLTPTRTRCDLVVFSGGINEKVASGLFEPFISHLQFAKDQILKGGYSITLRPPANDHASWFTKATFQRFVHFVSTPEVLERFVSIEREIIHMFGSFRSNELISTNVAVQIGKGQVSAANVNAKKSTDSSKLKGEFEGNNHLVNEENSKIHLHHLLETRKVLLRKEQAMAYARALVAGFQIDNIGDLISFADAFGAARLREACVNFRELYKKKHADDLWMDELAAMGTCSPSELSYLGASGFALTSEDSASSQNITLNFQNDSASTGNVVPGGCLDTLIADSTTGHASSNGNKDNLPASDQTPSTSAKVQVPMQWPNGIPQSAYKFQSLTQQLPLYKGYPFIAMQSVPSCQPGNLRRAPNMKQSSHGLAWEPDHHQTQKSSLRKKENSPNGKGPRSLGEQRQTESSVSDSGSGLDEYMQHETKYSSTKQPHGKKHRKKSSKTVVIRNINYIASKTINGEKDEASDEASSVEDEFINRDSLKQKVEDAVGSLGKHCRLNSHKNNKRGRHKSLSILNGLNGPADQVLEDNLVASKSDGVKRDESWVDLQNLLIRDEELTTDGVEKQRPIDVLDENFMNRNSEDDVALGVSHAVNLESEKVTRQRAVASDSFVVMERDGVNKGRVILDYFEIGENLRHFVNRRDYAAEELLLLQRLEESGNVVHAALSDCATESSVTKKGKGEDWFIVNDSETSKNQEAINEQTMLDSCCTLSLEDACSHTDRSRKGVLTDDSFMVQARSPDVDHYNAQWRTDMSMALELTTSARPESRPPGDSGDNLGVSGAYEPDDLYMVLERDSKLESAEAYWTPTVDYGIDISLTEANNKCSDVQSHNHVEEKVPSDCKSANSENGVALRMDGSGKRGGSKVLCGSLGRSKSDIMSKTNKVSHVSRPPVLKSKLEKEEENRKKVEELLLQRQKRIAERSAASGFTPAASKKVQENKLARTSVKHDKPTIQCTTQETKKLSAQRPGFTSSAIDRLVHGQINHNGGSASSKSGHLKKASLKINVV